LVAIATGLFGSINIHNAQALSPQWSQDLAFFHQWVHSAANGGPWASPLILEPQGFFEMVHTHFALIGVVGLYRVIPEQETLLIVHSFFAGLALWPVFRLGESVAGGRHAILCVLAVVVFGPFQSIAVADFRPVVLFLPGLLGVWAATWRSDTLGVLFWAAVALAGRQEASYLLVSSGLALLFCSWGKSTRKDAILLVCVGAIAWVFFAWNKPSMFFHINPMAPEVWPSSAELWDQRLGFGLALLLSGWLLGALAPAPLFAMLPVVWGLLSTSREWHSLMGPGAHHHVFWVPFVVAAGIVGSARVPSNVGPILLFIGSAFSFPWASLQSGSIGLQRLIQQVPRTARVAADYDTIHALAGRDVLWNIDQMYMEDRPWHWTEPWPITPEDVDWIIMPSGHPLSRHVSEWTVVDAEASHLLLRSPH
jgi:uncharacterized membrane protein